MQLATGVRSEVVVAHFFCSGLSPLSCRLSEMAVQTMWRPRRERSQRNVCVCGIWVGLLLVAVGVAVGCCCFAVFPYLMLASRLAARCLHRLRGCRGDVPWLGVVVVVAVVVVAVVAVAVAVLLLCCCGCC